jgi:hypothetical protein
LFSAANTDDWSLTVLLNYGVRYGTVRSLPVAQQTAFDAPAAQNSSQPEQCPFPLRNSQDRQTDRQTDTCPLLQELLRAGLGLPPELPPNCPLRPLAADTLLRRYGSSRLLLSPVDISIVGQTRNFSGLQFPGPVKFLPAAYRDYHTSPPAPPNCYLPVVCP